MSSQFPTFAQFTSRNCAWYP